MINSLQKIKCKPIIHTDHGIEHTNKWYHNLKKDYGFKQSMGRVGNSLDNRLAEYFCSILKSEYIRDKGKSLNYLEIKNFIKESMYDYNNISFQGSLQNKTPREYATLMLRPV